MINQLQTKKLACQTSCDFIIFSAFYFYSKKKKVTPLSTAILLRFKIKNIALLI